MATKKNSYISADLDFAEQQLAGWKKYIEAHPIEKIKDRWGKKETARGGVIKMVVQTIEGQIKCVQETMTKYLQLLEVIEKLREKEDQKKPEVRGKQALNPFESGEI